MTFALFIEITFR